MYYIDLDGNRFKLTDILVYTEVGVYCRVRIPNSKFDNFEEVVKYEKNPTLTTKSIREYTRGLYRADYDETEKS